MERKMPHRKGEEYASLRGRLVAQGGGEYALLKPQSTRVVERYLDSPLT